MIFLLEKFQVNLFKHEKFAFAKSYSKEKTSVSSIAKNCEIFTYSRVK